MDRQYYLDLAASGLRMPIGTDLVLREKADEEAILYDGERLGKVVEEAARRYATPLAIPLMDLAVEKEALLTILGVAADAIPTYHFHAAPNADTFALVDAALGCEPTSRMRANAGSISYIANNTDLVPCGMSIGPFSFMTKLVKDPIAPVFLAGTGVTADEDPEIANVEASIELGLRVILHSLNQQIEAGAKAIIVCEPAAGISYFSPKQLARGSDIIERFVMQHNRKVKELLESKGVALIFHDCGELTEGMITAFTTLEPVMLSLGSSRKLWEDAALVPDNIVLYGNLPSKRFYAQDLTVDAVEGMACELLEKMRATGHPYILGSECDVLSVPDVRQAITQKVDAFLHCSCG
jgi:uroporphyrinogen-III decarboxylase